MLIKKTKQYKKWFSKQKDKTKRLVVLKRLLRIEKDGYFGDYKELDEGVYELRFLSLGVRIYYSFRNVKDINGETKTEMVLLLCGGGKTSQQDDIKKAKRINKEIEHV